MKYRVTGKIMNKIEKKFSKQIEANSEKLAKQKIYSFFGNAYGLPRNKVTIEVVSKLE